MIFSDIIYPPNPTKDFISSNSATIILCLAIVTIALLASLFFANKHRKSITK